MELRVNDLLKINTVDDLIGDSKNIPWVQDSIKLAPYVVIRRAPIIKNKIPVGIRGNDRSKRVAAEVLCENIIKIITPEELSQKKLWRENKHIRGTKMFQVLEEVDKILGSYNIAWGPTGSAGFELSTGIETITDTSDLDIIARAPEILPMDIAKNIVKELSELPIKTDVQIEVPNGSISLEEYARYNKSLMLRTINGPRLVKNPWSYDEMLEG